MDYPALTQAMAGALNQVFAYMQDDQLLMLEKAVHNERQRRLAANLGSIPQGEVRVLINLTSLANAVTEQLRQEMSMTSPAALTSILEQIREYPEIDEGIVMKELRTALTCAVVHEAQSELKRRLDSVR